MDSYYENIRNQNYEKAQRSIEKNKLIKKNRNALLYNLEMGKLYRLQKDYTNSNIHLNYADAISENNRKSLGDIMVSNVANPMLQYYRGEDHEQFMMHYYKALNYVSMGLTDDAVVEAKRITLSNNIQFNKFKNKEKRYSQDAFALNLQGMIYEMAGDMNNAFIAYRNAVELYQNANNNFYYGVEMPAQLKKDYRRAANAMGFSTDLFQYENNICDQVMDSSSENGSLILFIEEGQAPVKEQAEILITSSNNGIGSFNYIDANGLDANMNFNYGLYGIGQEKLTDIRTMRIAMPKYIVQNWQPKEFTIDANGIQYQPQLAQNINSIATSTLRERYATELANALARQLTKKGIEKGSQFLATTIAKNNMTENKNDSTQSQKEERKEKQNNKAENIGKAVGFVFNMINSGTEKADTRNWQSLPAFVHYVRIPLHAGENKITINNNGLPTTIIVQGKKGLQMMGLVI